MKKKYFAVPLLVLGILLTNGYSVSASETFSIDTSEAKVVAKDFVEKNIPQKDLSNENELDEVQFDSQVIATNLHVFNLPAGGYVIVSGDERSYDILAYSEKGSIDPNNVEVNMEDMLEDYSQQVEFLEEKIDTPPAEQFNVATSKIAPMLDSAGIHYDQSFPYNLYTPVLQNGNNSATGCVATATAQLMKYHNYPAQGVRDSSYVLNNNYFRNLRLTAPISQRQYDWQNILPSYSGHESQYQKESIAQLMSDIGIAIQMDYGPSSGSYGTLAAAALRNNFGYPQDTRHVSRDYYSYEDWHNLVNNELQNSRPVYYEGVGNDGGHAFVVDGADGNGFYHVNWGWGGQADGYFRLDALNPSSLGTGGGDGGFNYQQGMIINVQPAR